VRKLMTSRQRWVVKLLAEVALWLIQKVLGSVATIGAFFVSSKRRR